ncbi:Rieske 2Fe-2S domain-containing protein [Metapseudomonas boanensis]|uniref:Aromatic ring-hydroxylating dioxygenase subunit alpha n=1 Tax=Metapseudomonas boanensis TaxID=2822138 RepID=A0ABS5XIE9_9GAMM|nr:Rieske 2Fe-2S domain-containing protein [Pseudomonas boanensis]MBT8766941.1 aromatic ring-hydroxylating dioxygenase subunit alpha [Pseudomonas boanensis]
MTTEVTQRQRAEQAMRRQWFPVARSVDLEKPQSATLLGEKLVVYRTASGQAVVQEARCPHRGANLSLGEVHGENIACPYHGWQFSAQSGKCSHVPSLEDQCKIPHAAAIRTFPCQERYGHVWTALEEPMFELYDLAEWRELNLEWLAAEPLDSPTGVAVAVENFGDVAHFSYIHRGMMGHVPPAVEPLNVRREGLDIWMDRPLISCEGEWANDGDCMMHYHIVAPGLVAITYDYERLGKRIVAGFPCPEAYDHVKIFWGVANDRDYKGGDLQECLRVEELLYLEDLPVAATITPREIDWDGNFVEHSVPSDLYTLNYRRAFREFIERGQHAPVRLVDEQRVAP